MYLENWKEPVATGLSSWIFFYFPISLTTEVTWPKPSVCRDNRKGEAAISFSVFGRSTCLDRRQGIETDRGCAEKGRERKRLILKKKGGGGGGERRRQKLSLKREIEAELEESERD